jgi:hypothetical protein
MELGAPQVTLDALLKLASILEELSERGRSRSSSGCPASQEVPDAPPPRPSPTQLTLTLEPDRSQPPKAAPSAALLEALAELLLVAMGTTKAAERSEEAHDERQDRR